MTWPGVGVDTDQASDLNVDAGLFAGLADGGLCDGLADVLAAAGYCPQVVVGAADHEDSTGIVLHEGGSRGHDAVGARGVGVVQVVPLGHGYCLPLRRLACLPHGLEALGVGVEEVSGGEPA